MPTQLPRVPSLMPSSFATRAIGRDVSITIFTASSLNSGEKLFFGRGNYFTFPDIHPNGWTVRKPRGTSHEGGGRPRPDSRAEDVRQRPPAEPKRRPRRFQDQGRELSGLRLRRGDRHGPEYRRRQI